MGGNAAKFISWIDFGNYSDKGLATKFLNAVFLNAVLDKELGEMAFKPLTIGQIQSPGHKDEAAGGAVVLTNTALYTEKSESVADADDLQDLVLTSADSTFSNKSGLGFVHGEALKVNNHSFAAFDDVDHDKLYSNTNDCLFNETELKQFDKFITIVNALGVKLGLIQDGSQINLSVPEKNAIKQQVRAGILKQATLKKEERLIEPVFISEIKLLDIFLHELY
ncbi:MAG: hypothetical protein IPK03_05500 [Bacteroidetes bacterium]|nr:hypothetical protein [Bacteroidota bacterium]